MGQSESVDTSKRSALDAVIYYTAVTRAWLKRTLFRTWLHIAAVLGIIVVTLLTFLLWSEFKQRFPLIGMGAYYGTLSGVFKKNGGGEARFYAEHKQGQGTILLTLLHSDWPPQQINIEANKLSDSDPRWLFPVMLPGKENSIRLIGSQINSREYRGIATNIGTGKEGRWELHLVKNVSGELSEPEEKNLQLWLLLRNELNDIEKIIAELEKNVPKQKEEITKLEEFVTEGSELKIRADRKLRDAQEELSGVLKQLKEKQAEIAKLESKVLIAGKVTNRGKLVHLSRKSLEREARWLESMFKTTRINESPKLAEALQRAEEILELKKSIALEKDRIVQLHSMRGR